MKGRNKRFLEMPSAQPSKPSSAKVIDEENQIVQIPISSTLPVYRQDYSTGYQFMEVLEHTPQAVDLSRANNGAALMDDHGGDSVGVFEKAWLEDDQVQAQLRFSKDNPRAVLLFKDMVSGIRKNVSIDYQTNSFLPATAAKLDGLDLRVCDSWALLGVSLVSIPADPHVGFRSLETERPVEVGSPIETEQDKALTEVGSPTDADKAIEVGSLEGGVGSTNSEQKSETKNIETRRFQKMETNIESKDSRVSDIVEYEERWAHIPGVREEARTALRGNVSLADFKDKVLGLVEKNNAGTQIRTAVPAAKPYDKDIQEKGYDIAKVIMSLADGIMPDGLEGEIHRELSKDKTSGRFQIPMSAFIKKRANNTTPASAGGYLVGVENQDMIELFRPKTQLFDMGVELLSGLQKDLTFPKQTGASTASWLGESAPAVSASQLTFGQIVSKPKHLKTKTQYSRTLLLQSNPSIQQLVNDDIIKNFAVEIERAILNGTGGPQPEGILNAPGVGTIDLTSVSYTKLLGLEAAIAAANADGKTLRAITTPAVRQILKGLAISTNGPRFAWEGTELVGYDARVSNLMPAGQLLFGDFSQVILGMWDSIEVEAVRSTNYVDYSLIDVVGFAALDVIVRQPTAFVKATTVSA